MPTISLRCFSNPDTLKHISESNLIALLSPHREFLNKRGFTLPASANPGGINHEALANIFMKPDTDMPKELADALFYIDEMSSKEMMDKILEQGLDLSLGSEPEPADAAVQLWLKNRTLLEEIHAEEFVTRPRSFLYFATETTPIPAFKPPTKKILASMEAEMDDWFEEKKRGRGCRVFTFPHDAECWFLVRHGQPVRREGSIDQGKPGSVFYRPEQHDVIIYDTAHGEIRIHAGSKGERELYLRTFGKHIFGDENFFPGEGKYTLQPLINDGSNALSTQGVEDHIECVYLKEVEIGWGAETEIRKSHNLFASADKRFKESHNLRKAVFSVKFKDSKTLRSVTIRPTNKANYDRDHDSTIIETWFKLRGFIKEND